MISKKKGLHSKNSQIFRKIQAFSKKKKKKKKKKRSSLPKFVNFPKIQAFFRRKISSKMFLQALWRSPRQNKIGHDLNPFSTSQKIVLSSSRGQGIFEDLQASRPRTSNCVLEDFTSAIHICVNGLSIFSLTQRKRKQHESLKNKQLFKFACLLLER